ncbi:hypothetical protein [Halalkalibaculum sp. DA384]|uniref:hypothetical protein n=1 Tax=Halalkalibaculum sp. DA384 TaxID=3373606 RepID=UPI003754A96C
MYLDQKDPIPANTNLLSDGDAGSQSKTPCEKLKAGENLSVIGAVRSWAQANKDWLPWAAAGLFGIYVLGRRNQ